MPRKPRRCPGRTEHCNASFGVQQFISFNSRKTPSVKENASIQIFIGIQGKALTVALWNCRLFWSRFFIRKNTFTGKVVNPESCAGASNRKGNNSGPPAQSSYANSHRLITRNNNRVIEQ